MGQFIEGEIINGTYTPTLTNSANIDSSTAYVTSYTKIGNMVYVSGKVDVNNTADATLTTLGISLPIVSNLANEQELAGVMSSCSSTAVQVGRISGDTANDRAQVNFIAAGTSNNGFSFYFAYRII